jgi:hypothetical protein
MNGTPSTSASTIDSAFDARLMAEMAAGDARAVGRLFDRYGKLAYNLAAGILRNAVQAEEVVLELFLCAWREATLFDPVRSEVKTWLAETTWSLAEGRLRPEERGREHGETEPPELPLPDGLKEKVLGRIEKIDKKAPDMAPASLPRKTGLFWPLLGFGFGLAASAVAVYSGFQANNLENEIQTKTAEINAWRQKATAAEMRLAFTLSPLSEVFPLTGSQAAPEAKGKVILSAQGQGVFTALGLPKADSGKAYQLWVVAAGNALPADLFAVDSTGAVEIKMAGLPPPEQISAFSVTLEPAEGSPWPTGVRFLAGGR